MQILCVFYQRQFIRYFLVSNACGNLIRLAYEANTNYSFELECNLYFNEMFVYVPKEKCVCVLEADDNESNE